MTFEEYQMKINLINNRLSHIEMLIFQMAVAGSAKPSNPQFREWMIAHKNLVIESEKLTKKMMNQK